jgi:CubicO group peptidase (beta-lactamase class C family)/D-alanyl-D-alanine dipeptidase
MEQPMNPSSPARALIPRLLWLVLLTAYGCHPVPPAVQPVQVARPERDYGTVVAELRRFIEREMRDKALPALSIALVDDQRTVWAEGFGWENPTDSIPATAETVYRVGSVSKLFTDIGIMQLVERGELDLDAPVSRYLPDFQPKNPYETAITLRQLMSHRSGLGREPPVGSYFDSAEPSLAQTVASLNDTELVYEPGTRTKYSNAAIGTVGYILERTQGEPFARYLERAVLDPLGMQRSSFEPRPEIVQKLAKAQMWTYDGRTFEAPTFQLGMAPAGSMYSTVTDLGRFLSALFAGGRGPGGQVLKPETLAEMWTPQFAPPGATVGFGIGFGLGELDGHRRIGHGGAIYGFATELAALPDEKLGVVVVTTKDIANSVTDHIADAALRMMLAAREGRPLPTPAITAPLSPELARRLDGRYGSGEQSAQLTERYGKLYLTRGSVRPELRSLAGDTLVADDALAYGIRLVPLPDGRVAIEGDTLARVAVAKPRPPPVAWRALIGEYGWDHDVLYIREKDGQLHALIEWFFDYPLEQVSENVFRFPNYGLYDGERLVFTRAATGRAIRVEAANVVFPRREIGTEAGETFRIDPVRPVAELRREALAAEPPRETGNFRAPDLVEPAVLDPTIKLDIRYATTNNFMSTVFYSEPRAFLQRPAAEALVRAHRKLKKQGYGLLIHDAYRPWYVTKMFWEATPLDDKVFVADPAQGSRHNRGAAVDLTLYDLETGKPIEMVGGYDEFSPRSYPDYPGGTSLQRWHRELLRDAMEEQGFRVYDAEWWHFDYQDWREYPILNQTFDQLEKGGR